MSEQQFEEEREDPENGAGGPEPRYSSKTGAEVVRVDGESSAGEFKMGDRVRHVEPTHVRNGDIGTIEGQRDFNGDWIVRWDKDGDNQKHVSHRSYPLAKLELLESIACATALSVLDQGEKEESFEKNIATLQCS